MKKGITYWLIKLTLVGATCVGLYVLISRYTSWLSTVSRTDLATAAVLLVVAVEFSIELLLHVKGDGLKNIRSRMARSVAEAGLVILALQVLNSTFDLTTVIGDLSPVTWHYVGAIIAIAVFLSTVMDTVGGQIVPRVGSVLVTVGTAMVNSK